MKKYLFSLITAVFMLFVVTVSAEAATYYVATTGDDTRSCTTAQIITTPKRTIASGLGCLSAGSTLYIRGGTYAEQLFETSFGGSGTSWLNPVTVAAYIGETVTLRPVTSQGNVARFANGSVSYVILDHLIFDGINAGGGSGASVMYCGPGSNHIRMTGGELRNGDGGGTLCEGDGHQWIGVHNHHNGRVSVSGGGANGYYNQGTTNALIEGGEIDNNVCYGVRFFNSAPSPTADNNIIRNVKIHNNGFGRGMDGTSQCASGGGGIVLGNNNNIAYNNLVYGNYWGINVNLGHPYSALKFYNNTIYNNDYGVDLGSGNSGILVRNNIVYANPGAGISNPGGSAVISNNLATDPKFVNTAANDFHLQSTSLAINAGATLAEVPTDFDGVSRPQPVGGAYDIGAYEFVSGGGDTTAPSIPTNLSATAVSSSQINLSWGAASDPESAITSYKLYYCSGSSSCTPSTLITLGNVTSHSHTPLTANTLYRYQVSAVSSGGEGGKSAVQSATTPAASPTITIGETGVLPEADSGNANLLVAQSAVLSQTATIQSLSFYVTNAAGSLRLGIYDATGPSGGPGNRRAETASFTPTTGWNTRNVITPASLTQGTYWIAYLSNDNALAFVKTSDASSNGKYYDCSSILCSPLNSLPTPFSTTPNTTTSHWSFYATLNTSAVSVSSLTLIPSLEGRPNPLPQGIAFTVSFFTPGTSTLITSMALSTNTTGQLIPTASQLSLLPQGTYDIRVASLNYLSRKMFNQVLTSANTLTSPALYAGDFNNDGVVNNFDWSVMATNWFTSFTTTDINKDGITNSVDYSFVNRNWNRMGE